MTGARCASSGAVPPEVDLVINCYERTFRDVLAPGFFAGVCRQNAFPFARRTVLVNNVDDRPAVLALARERIAADELDHLVFVEEHLGEALERTGLSHGELDPIPYFTDWALVAVTMPGPEWVLHWDAEVRLEQPRDWVSPTIALMENDRRVLVGIPAWSTGTLDRETRERNGDFALGYGFSDQIFLARRSELGAPVYGQRCIARLRYPVAHLGDIFEARLDSYMRHNNRLRSVYLPATYTHPDNMGVAYPASTPLQKLRYVRNRLVVRMLAASPWRPRCARYL